MNKLELNQLTCVRQSINLFSDLTISLDPGQALRLQGPNGSGKSSLLRLITGHLDATKGAVRFAGKEMQSHDFVFLDHKLLLKPFLTVHENLSFWARFFATPEMVVQKGYCDLGLARVLNLPARQISQGQAKRAQLMLLYFKQAPIWLLDEPLNSLDALYTTRLGEIIHQHMLKGGIIIYASHASIPGLPERVLNLPDFSNANEIIHDLQHIA